MVMVSQAPGEPVPAAADCTWEFQAAAGRSVRVVVETLDLEPYRSAAKEGDKVVIRSAGAADIELTSTSFQKSYDIASSGISLSLETDRNDVGKTYGGFKATAYAVDACPVVGGECHGSGLHVRADERVTGPGLLRRGRAVGCTCDLTGCPEGGFFDESTGGCEACPPGTFKSATGPTPCEPCPGISTRPRAARPCVLPARLRPGGWVLSTVRAERGCLCAEGRKVQRGERHDRGDARGQGTLLSFRSRVDVRLSMSEDDDACRGSSPGLEGYGNGLCKPHAHGPLLHALPVRLLSQ